MPGDVRKQNELPAFSEEGNGMGGRKDLTGQRFGKLVVLSPTEKRADAGSVVWLCRCDCGNLAEVSARRMVRGKARSCGCLSNPPLKDYVGKRFGRLTVLEYAGKKRKVTDKSAATITYWKCRCDCGNEIIAGQPELQNGDTQSCGCLQKDLASEALALYDDTSAAILERTKKRLRSDNTSGHTGVFRTKDGKWVALINFKKKRYWLGRYEKKEDAIHARERGEEMHDDFLDWYHREIAANPGVQKNSRNARRRQFSAAAKDKIT